MLVLSRKPGESIVIGNSIRIKIVELASGAVKLGIEAPPEVSIYREELYDEIASVNRAALQEPGSLDEEGGS